MKEIEKQISHSLDDVIQGFKLCSNKLKQTIEDNSSIENIQAPKQQKKITTYKTEKYIIILGGVAAALALLYFYLSIYYSLSLPDMPPIEDSSFYNVAELY